MSKAFSQFPGGNPPADTDRFLIGRMDGASPSGFSNFIMTWAQIRTALAANSIGNTIFVAGVDGEDGNDGIGTPGNQGVQGNTGISGADGKPVFLPVEAEEPEFPMMIPGVPGSAGNPGTNGIAGRDGLLILPVDGEDGQDAFPLLGNPGAAGNAGTSGRDGATIFLSESLDGEDNYPIPGPRGTSGTNGNNGSNGINGQTIFLPSFDEGTPSEDIIPPEYLSDKNLVYLGSVTGTGVTVGPLIWLDAYDHILFEYQIGGYNGGTPVGRLLCGNAAPSTVALTNGNTLLEGATLNVTSVSKPGCPLAVTLSSVARSGWGTIRGASGALKQIDIHGMSGNPAVATAPLLLEARSFFSDLGTNLPIKQIQLTVYDTLIAVVASAQTFTATTFIRAWGLRKNQ